jgi:hypothetical protein
LHPKYLDAKGLVALWREGLLAQKVLAGNTRGYRNHPQLDRFRKCSNPLAAIATYLGGVEGEAVKRGYHFDSSKIAAHGKVKKISVTAGQVAHELAHLKAKLKIRDSAAYEKLNDVERPAVHPLFKVVSGDIEDWEISIPRQNRAL